jgi:two-component sensor histidine kinase
VFQSITSRTLTGTRTVEEAREMLIGRLQSLGHAHELLTETSWMGADLKDIVQAEIAGFTERVRFSGPAVSLSPSGVQTFALIVHELSTNAAKYGALSSTNGEVVVDWQLGGSGNGRYMEFSWREKGGPQVIPTKHEGFGLSLINAMGSNATSRPTIDFAPEGFRCTLRVPLETIAPTRYDRASPMLAAGHASVRRAAAGGPAA